MSLEFLDDSKSEASLWTSPTDAHNAAKAFHAAVLTMNDRVAKLKDRNQLPPGTLETWRVFREKWRAWYDATNGMTWITAAPTKKVIEGFMLDLANWDANITGLEKAHAVPWTTVGLALTGIGLGFWLLSRDERNNSDRY